MKAVLIVLLIVAAVVFGLYARAQHWIDWPPIVEKNRGVHPFQVTGDPPITVSDGSLHVHSKVKGWGTETDTDQTLLAYPLKGKLQVGCGMVDGNNKPASALFWHEEKVDNISPATGTGLTITITHDTLGAGGQDATVTITIPSTQDEVKIKTGSGYFLKSEGNKYNRRHSRAGEVEQIIVQGGGNPAPWVPQYPNNHNPHFTLSFCYQ